MTRRVNCKVNPDCFSCEAAFHVYFNIYIIYSTGDVILWTLDIMLLLLWPAALVAARGRGPMVADPPPPYCQILSTPLACSHSFSRLTVPYSTPNVASETNKLDCVIYTGCANKNNPLGKIHYLSYCNSFFTKFTAFTEEDSRHIRRKFCHNICYGLKITTI